MAPHEPSASQGVQGNLLDIYANPPSPAALQALTEAEVPAVVTPGPAIGPDYAAWSPKLRLLSQASIEQELRYTAGLTDAERAEGLARVEHAAAQARIALRQQGIDPDALLAEFDAACGIAPTPTLPPPQNGTTLAEDPQTFSNPNHDPKTGEFTTGGAGSGAIESARTPQGFQVTPRAIGPAAPRGEHGRERDANPVRTTGHAPAAKTTGERATAKTRQEIKARMYQVSLHRQAQREITRKLAQVGDPTARETLRAQHQAHEEAAQPHIARLRELGVPEEKLSRLAEEQTTDSQTFGTGGGPGRRAPEDHIPKGEPHAGQWSSTRVTGITVGARDGHNRRVTVSLQREGERPFQIGVWTRHSANRDDMERAALHQIGGDELLSQHARLKGEREAMGVGKAKGKGKGATAKATTPALQDDHAKLLKQSHSVSDIRASRKDIQAHAEAAQYLLDHPRATRTQDQYGVHEATTPADIAGYTARRDSAHEALRQLDAREVAIAAKVAGGQTVVTAVGRPSQAGVMTKRVPRGLHEVITPDGQIHQVRVNTQLYKGAAEQRENALRRVLAGEGVVTGHLDLTPRAASTGTATTTGKSAAKPKGETLTYIRTVKMVPNTRAGSDERRKVDRHILEYRNAAGEEFRKTVETTRGVAPRILPRGTHADLAAQAEQYR